MRRAAWVTAVLLVWAAPASGQARRNSFEVAPAAIWFSGVGLGSDQATLERPGGGEFVLFETDTKMTGAIGGGLVLSFYPSSRLAVEAAFSYSRPSVETRVTDDAEDATDITSEIGLQQYLIEGNLRWYVGRQRGAWQPFLRAGGGYLRQLDDASAHVETGTTVQAGLGADRSFRERSSGRLRRVGLRLDARALGRMNGFSTSDSIRIGFSAGAALFLGF